LCEGRGGKRKEVKGKKSGGKKKGAKGKEGGGRERERKEEKGRERGEFCAVVIFFGKTPALGPLRALLCHWNVLVREEGWALPSGVTIIFGPPANIE